MSGPFNWLAAVIFTIVALTLLFPNTVAVLLGSQLTSATKWCFEGTPLQRAWPARIDADGSSVCYVTDAPRIAP